MILHLGQYSFDNDVCTILSVSAFESISIIRVAASIALANQGNQSYRPIHCLGRAPPTENEVQ